MCSILFHFILKHSFTDNIEIQIKEYIDRVQMQSNYKMSLFMLV